MRLIIKAVLGQLLLATAALAAAAAAAADYHRPPAADDVFSFPNKKFTDQHLAFRSFSIPFLNVVQQIRGGNLSEDDYDDYDDYDQEVEEEDDGDIYSSKRPPPRNSKRQPPPPRNSGRGGVPPHSRPPKKSKHWTQRMASQSLQMGGKLAWNTVKQPGKLAYHLIRPKHVDLRETGGLWRLDQQITSRGDRLLASVATVELNPRQRKVLIRQQVKSENGEKTEEKVIAQPYTFTKTRLGSYKTSFVAPAFLIGEKPQLYGYKGTWSRKVADKKVIKLVGKIYQVRRQKFGKEKGSFLFGKEVGTFVARRRVQFAPDTGGDFDDEYDDDEYDEEDDMGDASDEEEEEYDEESYDDNDY